MVEDVTIRPMTKGFILWRCLHGGPLSGETINQWPAAEAPSWERHRALNVPLLERLIQTYGTCAMLAWDHEDVVGFVRFYPKALLSVPGAGGMCLQQRHPAGPSARLLGEVLPPQSAMEDRTLTVHCLMTGSPHRAENPYQRVGLGSRLVREMTDWAAANGWRAIEAYAFEDVKVLYTMTGQAGRRFWEKLGFAVAKSERREDLSGELLQTVQRQLAEQGRDPELAHMAYTMRLDLAPLGQV